MTNDPLDGGKIVKFLFLSTYNLKSKNIIGFYLEGSAPAPTWSM